MADFFNGLLDIITATRLQCNCGEGSASTFTVTPTPSSTTVNVSDLTKVFVGQILLSSTVADGYTAQNYVVLSVSGASGAGTITLGPSYGGSAISASAATPLSVTYNGMPGIALIGYGTGKVSALEFVGLDDEGRQTCSIYLERAIQSAFDMSDMPQNNPSFCLRNSSTFNTIRSSVSVPLDADSSSALNGLSGFRGAVSQDALFGVFYDNALSTTCLNLYWSRTGAGTKTCDFPMAFSPAVHVASNLAIGQPSVSASSSCSNGSLSGYVGIMVIGNGSAGCTMVLPALSSAIQQAMPLWLVNDTAYPITISTDGTERFNYISSFTSVVVQPGQSVHIQTVADYGSGESAFGYEVQLQGAPLYSGVASLQTGSHTWMSSVTLAAGAGSFTVAPGFTSAATAVCTVADQTTPANEPNSYAHLTSGTAGAIAGVGTDVVEVSCTGY